MSAATTDKRPDPDVQAYCVHCRSSRPMLGAIQVCNRRGGRDLKGHCAVCGKSMYRLGGWDSVAANTLNPPATPPAIEGEEPS